MARVGLISDTHGLLREALSSIAPVAAVRGNNDRAEWARPIAETEVLQVEEVFLYVLHDLAELDLDPRAAGFQVVVHGHSHKPAIEERDGVLYVNPGSAGPRRFTLPIAAAELEVSGSSVRPRLVELKK